MPWLQRFARDENGAIIGFAVFIFLIILMVGGIGVDFMRSEMKRTQMQHTLDRAVLAAADLDQDLDPGSVVNNYFDKAGMSSYLTSVTVDEGLNYRTVSATASTQFDTTFMNLVGVDTLTVPAKGTAEERIDGLEISLVLDVSGSMNSNSRLSNLKVAARDFVDTMFENTEDDKLSISIVPYATQVSLPEEMFDQLNATIADSTTVITLNESDTIEDQDLIDAMGVATLADTRHDYSHCINFTSDDFETTQVSMNKAYQQTMHFDPWYDWEGRDDNQLVGHNNNSRPVCDQDPTREILPLSQNQTALKNYISAMWAGGNTSIDLGMKWGTALLDPSLQPMVDGLIALNEVDDVFSERPHEYDDNESLKVVVLMTDGQNTSQYYINDGYRNDRSNIWWNDQEEVYSVYIGEDEGDFDDDGVTEEPMFFWPHIDDWRDHAYGQGYEEEQTVVTGTEWVCRSYRRNGSCRRYRQVNTYETQTVWVDEPGEALEVDYEDLWAYTTMEWIVEDLYEPWMNDDEAWDDWYYDVRNSVGSSTKNTRTGDICDAAKAEGIIVFTIGFEAPSSGQTVLRDCASSASHYFDVDGLEIRDAFAAIASSIRQLRLTQ
ncbi:TadE/TadG family type IV pilus assembly protein [Shimia sp. SDUM112013]|uniref:TadE/TadG family type IV pilus assembly protein n=1 Tax=Shimia sp. SDUM112013 TaxID=3136160 RepID=UPI0032EAD316